MHAKELTSTTDTDQNWPQTPSGILIMGKRQGTKKENKQLQARAALAAALWYSAPEPKPYLLFVATDVHGPDQTPDAQLVKTTLTHEFGISADFVMLRPVSDCTLIEVRATRALSRIYGLSQIFALTHLFHAPRAQRYFNEIMPRASVIPVHPDILAEINFPPEYDGLLPKIRSLVEASQPHWLDFLREQVIEMILNFAHTLDPRGRFERWLARSMRPKSYR
jgi:hypothetical protein